MIKKNIAVSETVGGAKLSDKHVGQLIEIYCKLEGVSLADVVQALKTISISLVIRGGNTKYPVPAEHDFVFDPDSPKESAKYNGETCSVGVTLISDIDPKRFYKCGLKVALGIAPLIP